MLSNTTAVMPATAVVDPVCGMTVQPGGTRYTSQGDRI
jgi:hypothetical protein